VTGSAAGGSAAGVLAAGGSAAAEAGGSAAGVSAAAEAGGSAAGVSAAAGSAVGVSATAAAGSAVGVSATAAEAGVDSGKERCCNWCTCDSRSRSYRRIAQPWFERSIATVDPPRTSTDGTREPPDILRSCSNTQRS
jgi:hypothetical protein